MAAQYGLVKHVEMNVLLCLKTCTLENWCGVKQLYIIVDL